MEMNANLTPDAILNTQFDIDFKGYNAEQVDRMLDQVIEDYEAFEDLIARLNLQTAALQEENESLRQQLIEEQGKARARQDADPLIAATGNVDILKRLSRLENQVFNDKNRK